MVVVRAFLICAFFSSSLKPSNTFASAARVSEACGRSVNGVEGVQSGDERTLKPSCLMSDMVCTLGGGEELRDGCQDSSRVKRI